MTKSYKQLRDLILKSEGQRFRVRDKGEVIFGQVNDCSDCGVEFIFNKKQPHMQYRKEEIEPVFD